MSDDTRRGTGDDGIGSVSPAVVLALVAVAGAVVAGAAFAQSAADGPSGEAIVEQAHARYAHAETVTGRANVTVSNGTATRSAEVAFAAAEPNASRVAVTADGTTLAAGTNGTVAWVAAPEYGFVRTADATDPNASAVCAPPDAATLAAANGSVGLADDADTDADSEDHDWNASAWLAERTNGTYTSWQAACEAAVANWSASAGHGDDGDGGETDDDSAAGATATPTDWDWTDNVTATRTGIETIDGTEAYVVALEPVNESYDVRGTAWVATDDSRLLRLRLTDGTNETDVRYDDQAFNVSIHESTFRPPTTDGGVYDVDRYDSYAAVQDATALDLPRLAADGFAFETAAVTTYRGDATVAQSYANDTATVSLVTTDADDLPYDRLNGTAVTVDGREATAATVRDRTVVFWTIEGDDDGTVTHAVVSELSTDEVVALAGDVASDDGATAVSDDADDSDDNGDADDGDDADDADDSDDGDSDDADDADDSDDTDDADDSDADDDDSDDGDDGE